MDVAIVFVIVFFIDAIVVTFIGALEVVVCLVDVVDCEEDAVGTAIKAYLKGLLDL